MPTELEQTVYSLMEIPQDIIEHIIKFCARDLSTLSQTCKTLYRIIYNSDQHVWREAFLSYPFDDIRQSPVSRRLTSSISSGEDDKHRAPILCWKGHLQRRISAELLLRSKRDVGSIDGEDLLEALQTVTDVVRLATPGPFGDSGGANPSHNLAWAQELLLSSTLFRDYDVPELDRTVDSELDSLAYRLRQERARLRSYLTLSRETGESTDSVERLNEIRSASRCFVYNLLHYQDETRWGPYDAKRNERGGWDVTVDWEHVEHIQNVVFMNLRDLPAHLGPPIPSFDMQAARPFSHPGYKGRNPRDWAGVEGVWCRVVCFMDYRDLFAFNYTNLSSMRLQPAYFDDDFAEATRLVEVRLTLDDETELAPEDDDDPDPAYPPLAFVGTARGMLHNHRSLVHGTIRKKKDYVRWSFITTHDRSRWAAEGVQVGGVASALGVAGIWTVATHEDHGDPAGPFWMWKTTGELSTELLRMQEF